MSYILDALRRSEQERRRLGTGDAVPVPETSSASGWRRLGWLLVMMALLLNAGAVAWLLLRDRPAESPAPVVAAREPGPPVEPPPLPPLAEVAGRPQPLARAAEPAPAAGRQPPAATISPAQQQPDPPLLSTLPAEFQSSVPAVGISVHVYAQQPAARWVLANGRRFREGQEIATGLRLERITPDGVVLAFQGRQFLLRVR